MESSKKKKPLQSLVKFFNKRGMKNRTEIEESTMNQDGLTCEPWNTSESNNRLEITSPSEANFDEEALEAELEALHLSRVDNPYIQLLSSQDNLDAGPRSPRSPSSLQSPPSDQQSSIFSPTLSDVHSHLVRSPPPISWPNHSRRFYPVSPRSTGTFSPDSSDGLEMDNLCVSTNLDNEVKVPVRGYSPFNTNSYSRSHSEEHILSPCRDLLHKSEALFSPIRGANTDMLSQNALSPRSGSCYDYQNRRLDGRTSSFMSTIRSSRITLNQMPMSGSRRNFYYTMSYEDNLEVASPNRNQISSEYGALSPTGGSTSFGHRQSLAGKLPLSAFSGRSGSGGWSCSLRRRNLSRPESSGNSSNRPFFFSSWRRSYSASKGSKRLTSPGVSGSSKKRITDVKSMENLLSSTHEEQLQHLSAKRTLPFDC